MNTLDKLYDYLRDLNYILEINLSDDPEHIFNTMDWEEKLVDYYITLKNAYKKDVVTKKRNIKSIETFLRKEKLKRLK